MHSAASPALLSVHSLSRMSVRLVTLPRLLNSGYVCFKKVCNDI